MTRGIGELSSGSSDVLARGDGGGVGLRVERKYESVFIATAQGGRAGDEGLGESERRGGETSGEFGAGREGERVTWTCLATESRTRAWDTIGIERGGGEGGRGGERAKSENWIAELCSFGPLEWRTGLRERCLPARGRP